MKRLLTIAFSLTATAALAFAQGAPASLDSSFQTRYASHLTTADAAITITNTGATGAGTAATGTTATITGAICVNIYAMASDEQEVSCCSCPVTPDGLVTLSVKNDLLSNTLTPATVASATIKLYATVPVAGSCTGSAALSGATPAPGLAAWGTSAHVIPGNQCFTAIETPFLPSTPSAGELNKLQSFCAFAIANGSGYGVCNSCNPLPVANGVGLTHPAAPTSAGLCVG